MKKPIESFMISTKGSPKGSFYVSDSEPDKIIHLGDTGSRMDLELSRLSAKTVAFIMYENNQNVLPHLPKEKSGSAQFIIDVLDAGKAIDEDKKLIPNAMSMARIKDMYSGNEIFDLAYKMAEYKVIAEGKGPSAITAEFKENIYTIAKAQALQKKETYEQ